jgi:hypothetical protein
VEFDRVPLGKRALLTGNLQVDHVARGDKRDEHHLIIPTRDCLAFGGDVDYFDLLHDWEFFLLSCQFTIDLWISTNSLKGMHFISKPSCVSRKTALRRNLFQIDLHSIFINLPLQPLHCPPAPIRSGSTGEEQGGMLAGLLPYHE